MSRKGISLLWQVPVSVIASMIGSLVAVWLASQVFGFTFDTARVAILSAVLSASVIGARIHRQREG